MQEHWMIYFDHVRNITDKAGGVMSSLKMKLEKLKLKLKLAAVVRIARLRKTEERNMAYISGTEKFL